MIKWQMMGRSMDWKEFHTTKRVWCQSLIRVRRVFRQEVAAALGVKPHAG